VSESTTHNRGYRPGLRGWWQYLRLRAALIDGDGPQWRAILRRGRPSARLRQSEQEREYWFAISNLPNRNETLMSSPQQPTDNPYMELVTQIQQITGAPVTVLLVADEKLDVAHLEVATALTADEVRNGLPVLLRRLADEVEGASPEGQSDAPLATVSPIDGEPT
jgi:hypothetical protein